MEYDEERDRTICGEVFNMSISESRTLEISRTPLTLTDTRMEVGVYHHGLVTALSRSPKGNNIVWVVFNHLAKSAHFISFRVGQLTEFLVDKYMWEIV